MPHVETFVNGVWYPSTTTIIGSKAKPWLDAWYDRWGKLAERKTKIASAIGTAFHDCIEQYLNTGEFTVVMGEYESCIPRVTDMVTSWIDWNETVNGTIDYTELKVISNQYFFSGTLDAVGNVGKTKTIFDWKSSSSIYPEMALQLAAYAQAYKETTGIDIKIGTIVHVSKDKPTFKLTVKTFKLGKRVLNKFLKLREKFKKYEDDYAKATIK